MLSMFRSVVVTVVALSILTPSLAAPVPGSLWTSCVPSVVIVPDTIARSSALPAGVTPSWL